MSKRTMGRAKLSPRVRQRLAEMVAEARELVYGQAGCPEWGTLFAEIEDDAKEVGHEFIRLLMQQSADAQVKTLPDAALTSDSGEVARVTGQRRRIVETESGEVSWPEPKASLPRSRKDFFPSVEGFGAEG